VIHWQVTSARLDPRQTSLVWPRTAPTLDPEAAFSAQEVARRV
jgi:hypothetical protein